MYYQANAVDVALRKESVDRNIVSAFDVLAVSALPVALRKESVDRNYRRWCPRHSGYRSLSARRAWIEMHPGKYAQLLSPSLSARRAWIEIL